MSLYTSYDQTVVDAFVTSYGRQHPAVHLKVFRAPTGQINARIAAEQRTGGTRADVLLLSDPLSMQRYAKDGLLKKWTPADASAVPVSARTGTFWGVSSNQVVVVYRAGSPAPAAWNDLTAARYRGKVAVPDPGFAGTALGALGYFAQAPGYGLDFYRRLKANGAVQVKAPGDVITGVAQGQYTAGMSLAQAAQVAIKKGSPIKIATPTPGAITVYAPVAVVGATKHAKNAESFADFLLTAPAQSALAKLGRRPIRSDVAGVAAVGPEVAPDWATIFRQQDRLLDGYRGIFGG